MTQTTPIEAVDSTRAIFTLNDPFTLNTLVPYVDGVLQNINTILHLTPIHVAHIDPTIQDTGTWSGSHIAITAHPFTTGDLVSLTADVLPTVISITQAYTVEVIDVNTIRVNTDVILSGSETTLTVTKLNPPDEDTVITYMGVANPSIFWTAAEYEAFFSLTTTMIRVDTQGELDAKVTQSLGFSQTMVRDYLKFGSKYGIYHNGIIEYVLQNDAMGLVRYAIAIITTKLLMEESTALSGGIITERIEKMTAAIAVTQRYQGYGANNITTIFKSSTNDILDEIFRFAADPDADTTPSTVSAARMYAGTIDRTNTTRADILTRP